MHKSPLPHDEPRRLTSLAAYQVLDTPPDPRFDNITQLASVLFNVPIVLISLVDECRQWFKSAIGVFPVGSETTRDFAFCSYALLNPEQPLIVENAADDSRFADNPLVTGTPGLRFYAGIPLIGSEGYALGTLCVLDTRSRQITELELNILSRLAICVTAMLDLHRSESALQESEEHYRLTAELTPHIFWTADPDGGNITINRHISILPEWSRKEAAGQKWLDSVHPDDLPQTLQRWSQAIRAGEPYKNESRFQVDDNSYRWFSLYAAPSRSSSGEIQRWYGIGEDITERKSAQSRIEYLAYHDSLTGLLSWVRFRELLDHQLSSFSGGSMPFALLYVDLDDFKAVNDTLGHLTGDALLRHVAKQLITCVRGTDIVARVGGDEFCIIQRDLQQPEGAAALAARIHRKLRSSMHWDSQSLNVGASIGIAIYPQDGNDPEKLMQSADLALYRAKSDGRAIYRFFEPMMDERLRTRQALKIDMRDALDRGEFELAYQPIMSLHSGKIEGFEALLRWKHPTRGSVSPAEFIPVAEVSGLILPISRWVLEQACFQAKQWPDHLCVAVNISSILFSQDDLPQAVTSVLTSTGLAPERLELEITESVPLLDNNQNLTVLRKLREIGVKIALDDFGTGYASLAYLLRFPFERLKIDKSFVNKLGKAEEAQAIVRAIISMSRALKIVTTAEGVETREQLEHLRNEGCDQVQGFFFSMAVRAEEIQALIEALGTTGLKPVKHQTEANRA